MVHEFDLPGYRDDGGEEPFRLVSERVPQEMVLRPYQSAGVEAIRHELGRTGRTLGILATGTGKTELAAELIRTFSNRGALFIAPLKQLVAQTAARLRDRGIPCGVEQGGNKSDEKVTVACYASLLSRQRWQRFIGTIDLIIVDEVHTNFSRRSMEMLDNLTHGGVRLLGLTASPERGRGDPLTDFYGSVGFYYPISQATEDGWLVPSKVWLSVIEAMDLSRLRAPTFGDFNEEDLCRVMQQESVVQAIASLIEQHHEGQPSVVFCQSIRQTELLIDNLRRRGLAASMVHSQMEDEERRMHLSDFDSGRVNIIANVGVLTLGWDSPKVRKLFLAKPTKSKAVYVQQYGRGTRVLPNVVFNWMTAEQRRAAIAASAKPFFEVFDITDSSRHNDLCSSLDVLIPDLEPELAKRTKRQIEARGGTMDIDRVVAEARKQQAREQEARDRLEWSKRDGVITDASFGNYGLDVFRPAEITHARPRGWHMLFGKYKGMLVREVPTGYLGWFVSAADKGEINCRNVAFLSALRMELSKRRSGK